MKNDISTKFKRKSTKLVLCQFQFTLAAGYLSIDFSRVGIKFTHELNSTHYRDVTRDLWLVLVVFLMMMTIDYGGIRKDTQIIK